MTHDTNLRYTVNTAVFYGTGKLRIPRSTATRLHTALNKLARIWNHVHSGNAGVIVALLLL